MDTYGDAIFKAVVVLSCYRRFLVFFFLPRESFELYCSVSVIVEIPCRSIVALLASKVSSMQIDPTPIDLLDRSWFVFLLVRCTDGIGSAWTLVETFETTLG